MNTPKLNLFDIQGFVARGYNLPYARYLLAEFADADAGRRFVAEATTQVTSAERWEGGNKPDSTLNLGFTWAGLQKLGLSDATLMSFPVEFYQGMRGRSHILGDVGKNSPEEWDPVWRNDQVHAWIAVNALSEDHLDRRTQAVRHLMADSGVRELYDQPAAALVIDGKPTAKEHFGYTDGFGNPDFAGIERSTVPGQGKLMPDGTWAPLATGEFLLGYPDEAQELPVCPVPYLLGINGTFMAYRKLHQNVASFRAYMKRAGAAYAGGAEKLAAKFVGRWPDGTPLEGSPLQPDPAMAADPQRNTNFTYGSDPNGARCPVGGHMRRAHPRDAFGFNGNLVNRRRIMRRGLPYGAYALPEQAVSDDDDRGIIFMALGASLFRQFEFVQQQWIGYGNDAHLGNDVDPLLGVHSEASRFMVQGTDAAGDRPFVCTGLPGFVNLRGGAYFFLPSLTALRLIATGSVDPR